MKVFFICLAVMFSVAIGSLARPAEAQVTVGMSEDLKNFYVAVGEYYRVPQREVIFIQERHISDEEVPVVLAIARKARVAPAAVIDIRLSGKTWAEVTRHFGQSPEIFYVPVKVKEFKGPPYGKAYGYYKNKPRKAWKEIALDDEDVINLVNLNFISVHDGYPPEEVIRMREQGKKFVVIHNEVRKEKKGQKEEGKEKHKEKHKGKGNKED